MDENGFSESKLHIINTVIFPAKSDIEWLATIYNEIFKYGYHVINNWKVYSSLALCIREGKPNLQWID